MRCPRCISLNLNETVREGVEIDICPECRGVWLDRGELEKIIERSYSHAAEPIYSQHHNDHDEYRHQYHDKHHHDDGYDHSSHHRKKSWLFDIFD
jgi:Zn-finger nucleic acid-binding protein